VHCCHRLFFSRFSTSFQAIHLRLRLPDLIPPPLRSPRLRLTRLPLGAASVIVAFALCACGSGAGGMQQFSPTGPPQLPPAIPAAQPVLLFNGTGASSNDVTAVESILGNLKLSYATADSSQLNAMSEQQLGGYKLIIIPGGNSITIGESLTTSTASAIQGAVQQYWVHYLGLCAGAFFGGYSIYNGVNLTDGVSFNFYEDEFKGIQEEAVEISFPSGAPLDLYWQDGPQLSGWGEVVAKFPDGTPAITEGQSGGGFVVFTGVHPEAPQSWLSSTLFTASTPMNLAYAATLFQAALDGTPLPHF
jgi:hypothetical protein